MDKDDDLLRDIFLDDDNDYLWIKNDSTPEYLLYNLLACMNGDGGHYQQEHGVPQATKHAVERFYALLTELDRIKYEHGIE